LQRLLLSFVLSASAWFGGCGGVLIDQLAICVEQLDAGLAPLVFQIAKSGDTVGQELVRWAGRELGDLAVGVIRQIELEAEAFEIVLAGSFYKGSPLVIDELKHTILAIAPKAKFVRLNAPPVVGGVILGMQQVGLDTTPAHQQLVSNKYD
jgi:N-acetylglucosamine kinase-like BadF-type ATPase